MLLLCEMCQHQSLPAFTENILAAGGSKLKPAARLAGFQQKMYLRIVAKRFKMPHAFHRVHDCLPVNNTPIAKFYRNPKTFRNQAL